MGKSYGFIEITGVVAAIDALDIMCKTADVELASWERKLGGRLVTIIVEGDVSAVTEAVNAAATGINMHFQCKAVVYTNLDLIEDGSSLIICLY